MKPPIWVLNMALKQTLKGDIGVVKPLHMPAPKPLCGTTSLNGFGETTAICTGSVESPVLVKAS